MFYHQKGSVVSLYVSRSSYHLKRADSVSYSGMSISELLAFRGGALKLKKNLNSLRFELYKPSAATPSLAQALGDVYTLYATACVGDYLCHNQL